MISFMQMLSLEIPRWVERRAGVVGDDYITSFQAACFRVYVEYTTGCRRDDYPAKFAREVGVLNVCRRRPLVAQALADAGYGEDVRRISIKRLASIIECDARSDRQMMEAVEIPPRVDLSHLVPIKGWDDLDLDLLEDDLEADVWPELRSDEAFDNARFSDELDLLIDELDADLEAPIRIPAPFLL